MLPLSEYILKGEVIGDMPEVSDTSVIGENAGLKPFWCTSGLNAE